MGRTVDFSWRMLYDKDGFARTQSRIIESCPRMPCGGYRKGRKTARCQPERNGAKEPHANGTVGARMHRSGLGRRDESPPLGGSSPEKVGCKRGAIGSTARGRRIARRRTFSAAGVIFVGRRQDPCAAGVSFFRGCTGGFCTGRVSVFPPPQTHSVDLPETAGHKFFTGGKCI